MFVKVSGMVTEDDWKNWKEEDFTPYLDIVFDAFGPDRVMVGSDWPSRSDSRRLFVVMTLCGEYGQVVDIVRKYIKRFSEEDQAKIMGGNAIRFYKLKMCVVC